MHNMPALHHREIMWNKESLLKKMYIFKFSLQPVQCLRDKNLATLVIYFLGLGVQVGNL